MSAVVLGWTIVLTAGVSGAVVGLLIGLWFDARTSHQFWELAAQAERLGDLAETAAAEATAWRTLAHEFRDRIAVMAGRGVLNWRAETGGRPDRALCIGAIYVGAVDNFHPPLKDGKPWRAWVQTCDDGQLLGWFFTEDEAKRAVFVAVETALAGTAP